MDCPYCGKELSKNPVWRIEQAEAFYCPDCRRIIVPVPEIETTGQKLKKKLDQIRSDIEKNRENWQEQKAEQKEDKKWNKRKGKDPWEW